MSDWWASLQHGGLLIAPSKLVEFFPETAWPLSEGTVDRLRRDVIRAQGGERKALLDTVLELVLDLSAPDIGGRWLKGTDVLTSWTRRGITGEAVRPVRIWLGPHDTTFPVFWDDATRVGIGAGRRTVARVIEWLRRDGGGLALLTNGLQWRLIHAGLDSDAFAEWDAGVWFEEGVPGLQVAALQTLLSVRSLGAESPGAPCRLLRAIEATRRGQAELSAELGEQVRRAVELLLEAQGTHLAASGVPPRQIYVAAVRLVMRMVVALFAEARDLLPRDNPLYHGSYGLQGLREELERIGGGVGKARLRHRRGAWPRLLALFRLVHAGSPHEQLPVPAYGGGLFEAGNPGSTDALSRALAVLEDPAHEVSDEVVLKVLELLTRARVRVRQGNRSTTVPMPVDFSDLSSEYIGILYEGLLDFELRRVAEDDPIVFLRLGDEPALPLSRLEQMDDRALGGLLAKFKQKQRTMVTDDSESGDGDDDEEASDGDEAEDDEQADAQDEAAQEEPGAAGEEEEDERKAARDRALAWARRAVIAGKLAPSSRRRGSAAAAEQAQAVEAAAEGLLARIVLPGEWFLVRFGGTRKGSGTFYTRPALAVPTVQRTLRPLAYRPPVDTDGNVREDAPPAEWAPNTPDTILGLKVCDPAVGSASFLVAALRFLTEALAESLHAHGRIRAQGDQALVTLALGAPGGQALAEELLPCRPDAPEFDARLKARLRRYVVERCLYGVDLDPLAIELGRMALWIETMDRSLPFGFLDHKVKCGNALVGCWFDRFRDYPALAFEREGGDKTHGNGVHFAKGAWTDAIKAFRNDRLKPALVAWISGAGSLFDTVEGKAPEAVHDEALRVFEAMHALPVHETEERARLYRERVQGNPAVAALREAFDTWCALWFWPADQLELAPLPQALANQSEDARAVVRMLVAEHRFFHWEFEFPDVFSSVEGGFDAIVGNPPWEIQKPNSKEFFSNLDPLYRTYGKQEGLRRQRELFAADGSDERAWLDYVARLKALSAWVKHAGSAFGDPSDAGATFSLGGKKATESLHAAWRARRQGRGTYSDRAHPFWHQGSADVNTYKLFMEQAWALVRSGGRVGMITPSGLYTDKGSAELRMLFLDQGQWCWLFGFENRDKLFDIDSRFKFCPVIVKKGGRTEAIETAFMRREVSDWAAAEKHAVPYRREQVTQFSPSTRAILEIRNRRDLEILEKIYANSVLLGDQGPEGWGLKYGTDFHMTNDSKLFHARPALEAEGYVADEYGRWLLGRWRSRERGTPADPARGRWELAAGVILSQDGGRWIEEGAVEEVALPLYQGVMVGQFDPFRAAWRTATGRSGDWQLLGWEAKRLQPRYLIKQSDWGGDQAGGKGFRVGFRDIASTTNERTMIAAVLPAMPCGNKVPVLTAASGGDAIALVASLNSFVFDCVERTRQGAASLNYFIVAEGPLPELRWRSALAPLGLALNASAEAFSPLWFRDGSDSTKHAAWRSAWALTIHERTRIRAMLDAVTAVSLGLDLNDLAYILRGCDFSVDQLRGTSQALDPKGFWRVDRSLDPELRHTVLSIIALHELQAMISTHGGDREQGTKAFFSLSDGEGWMPPETLRLSDYGLGHDDRARQHQPVRERLGPRFLDFQLEQSVEDSWRECRLHARNLLGEAGFAALERELAGESRAPVRRVAEPRTGLGEEAGQAGLFDE